MDGSGSTLKALHPKALRELAGLRVFREGFYKDLNIGLAIDYMHRRFVAPVARHVDLSTAVMADCAAGIGTTSFAFLLAGGKKTIMSDFDEELIEVMRRMAELMDVADRCEFIHGKFQDLKFAPDSIDIFASIDTLEHVGGENIARCIDLMASAAKQAIVFSTPNAIFPIIAHDTFLPLAHWLPLPLIKRYAAAFGRSDREQGNSFVKPWQLRPIMRKFRPVSRFVTFETIAEFDAFYPHYLPYRPEENERWREAPKRGQRLLQRGLAALAGNHSYALAPSLASVWLRK